MSRLRGTESFAGTERFELRGQLGAGGMGLVHRAFDRSHEREVALKLLTIGDGRSLYNFKQEFRSLADISHPNLVALHELVQSGPDWFLTMELVEGQDFMAYLQGDSTLRPSSSGSLEAVSTELIDWTQESESAASSGRHQATAKRSFDEVRLRDAFLQLATGIHALHEHGKVHCDLKPSNILVEREGRVVILDFGLVTDVDAPIRKDGVIAGTAEYMSPEQGSLGEVGPPSDWYAVGTLLYEALTGQRPFQGRPLAILKDKLRRVPDPPGEIVANLPEDLCDLCMALLRREAGERPSGEEVLRILGAPADAPGMAPSRLATHSTRGGYFVGREEEMQLLRDSFAHGIENQEPHCILLDGQPGMGKSSLLSRFERELSEEHGALVLLGRCYEGETLAFKAVDSVVDALTRHLGSLPDEEVEVVLPDELSALVRLFPVLRSVRSISRRRRKPQSPNLQEVRRQGLAALRQLLVRLSQEVRLVIQIDDFQWSDVDSASLLADLFEPPSPPSLLLCISFRTEEGRSSEAVALLRERARRLEQGRRLSCISLEPLRRSEVHALAEHHLRSSGQLEHAAEIETLAHEADGSPFFVEELIRYLQSRTGQEGDEPGIGEISLEQATMARISLLQPSEKHILQLVGCAGIPVPEDVVLRAAKLDGSKQLGIAVLRAAYLLRSSRRVGDKALVECYHGRIRTALLQSLDASKKEELFRELGLALEELYPEDYSTLAGFYDRAGWSDKAVEYAPRAAARAEEALGFGRAASFYEIALRHLDDEKEEQRLRVKYADALANAGRGSAAAPEYMKAAAKANAAGRLELRRRAAEQFLRSGHTEEGVATLREVLEEVGLHYSPRSSVTVLSLLRRRAQLRLRGLRFKEVDASEVSEAELRRVDICWSCAIGLGPKDTIRGADLQTQHLLLALRAGEPYRVARSLALEGAYRGVEGPKAFDDAIEVIALAESLAESTGNHHAAGLASFGRGQACTQSGKWRRAFEHYERAVQIFREKVPGASYELAQAQRFGIDTLFYAGEFYEVSRRVPEYLRNAKDRGDLQALGDMRAGLPNSAWLVGDFVARAKEELAISEDELVGETFYLQHYYLMLAQCHIDFYEGRGDRALARVDAIWPKLKRALFLRIQMVRFEGSFVRGRACLAAASAARGSEQRHLLRRVRSVAKSMSKERIVGADAVAALLRAGAASLEGHVDAAVEEFAEAEQLFSSADMAFGEALSARERGRLIGGDEGRELEAHYSAWTAANHIAAPESFSHILLPRVSAC